MNEIDEEVVAIAENSSEAEVEVVAMMENFSEAEAGAEEVEEKEEGKWREEEASMAVEEEAKAEEETVVNFDFVLDFVDFVVVIVGIQLQWWR